MRFDLQPFDTIEAARDWARLQIDESAGAARARYLTIVPGQDVTYSAKYADALAYSRAGYPEDQVGDFPWVQAEARATASTAREATDGIRAVGDPWNMLIGPAIESLRIGGKTLIDQRQEIADVIRQVYETKLALAQV